MYGLVHKSRRSLVDFGVHGGREKHAYVVLVEYEWRDVDQKNETGWHTFEIRKEGSAL